MRVVADFQQTTIMFNNSSMDCLEFKTMTKLEGYLSKQITGSKAPAASTSFVISGDEWTSFSITTPYKKALIQLVLVHYLELASSKLTE